MAALGLPRSKLRVVTFSVVLNAVYTKPSFSLFSDVNTEFFVVYMYFFSRLALDRFLFPIVFRLCGITGIV